MRDLAGEGTDSEEGGLSVNTRCPPSILWIPASISYPDCLFFPPSLKTPVDYKLEAFLPASSLSPLSANDFIIALHGLLNTTVLTTRWTKINKPGVFPTSAQLTDYKL